MRNPRKLSLLAYCVILIGSVGVSAAEPAAVAAPALHQEKRQGMSSMHRMEDHMQRMQAEMDKIAAAKDPKEKEKLMAQHMDSMREHMRMMESMRTGGKGCMMKPDEPKP